MKARWKYAHAQQVWAEMPGVNVSVAVSVGDLVNITAAGVLTLATQLGSGANATGDGTHIIAQGDDTLLNNTVPLHKGIYKTDRSVAVGNPKNIAVYRITDANRAWVETY